MIQSDFKFILVLHNKQGKPQNQNDFVGKINFIIKVDQKLLHGK